MGARTMVDELEALSALATACARASRVALATETNATHGYPARLCVVALAFDDGHAWLLDVVALERARRAVDQALAPLGTGGCEVVVHGGEYDVAALKRGLNLAPSRVLDTQQAASLLGLERTGYRALVGAHFGVALPPAFSAIDWRRRPLTDEARDQALGDVEHLLPLADRLKRAIALADLEDELAIASAEVAWTPADVGAFEPEGFYRLKGAPRLAPQGVRVLRAVWLWREHKARELDRPPGRLLPNAALMGLASDPPTALDHLSRVGFHSQLLHDDRAELLRWVAEALASAGPLPERRVKSAEDPAVKARLARLKAWRREEAQRRGVGLQAILPRRAMLHLARRGAASLDEVPQLGRRRAERYGATLRALCGHLA